MFIPSLKEHRRCLLEEGGNTTIHSGVFVGIFDVSAITSYNPINAISYYLFGPSNSSFLLHIILYMCPAKSSWQYHCDYSDASVAKANEARRRDVQFILCGKVSHHALYSSSNISSNINSKACSNSSSNISSNIINEVDKECFNHHPYLILIRYG